MKRGAFIIVVLLLALFAYGMTRLFQLRFDAGDVYPPYSSLRSDPLGTKAFYESLDMLLDAERNYKAIPRFEKTAGTVLWVLGVNPAEAAMSEMEWKAVEEYVVSGGRLVLTFNPIFAQAQLRSFTPPAGENNQKARKSRRGQTNEVPEELAKTVLQRRWKVGFKTLPLRKDAEEKYQPAPARTLERGRPGEILVHSALCFDKYSEEWEAIYSRTNGCAVVLERKLGSGSIVLAADSYWFSNEALFKERDAELLTWFSGNARRAIFDETHLGVTEQRGIATLARNYGLHGFGIASLGLALLFIWRFSTSLIPPQAQASPLEGELIEGKESALGFSNLLRRSIPEHQLLPLCVEEWKKSSRPDAEKEAQVQSILQGYLALPEKERDPSAFYARISQLLSRRIIPPPSGRNLSAT